MNNRLLGAAVVAMLGQTAVDPIKRPDDEPGKPRRMKIGVTPLATMQQWDVYLEGVKQTTCIEADRHEGYVVRYKHADKKRWHEGTERAEGLVEFVRHGRPYVGKQP